LNLRLATIAPAAEQRIRELAIAAYPNEGCGVLLGRRDGTRMVHRRRDLGSEHVDGAQR